MTDQKPAKAAPAADEISAATRVADLNISVRAANILKALDCRTVGDAWQLSDLDLKRAPNCGAVTVAEIRAQIGYAPPDFIPSDRIRIDQLELFALNLTAKGQIDLQQALEALSTAAAGHSAPAPLVARALYFIDRARNHLSRAEIFFEIDKAGLK